MENILVTGATGYIGRTFCAYVQQHPAANIKTTACNLRQAGWRGQDFGAYSAVVHAAGLAHVKETAHNRADYFAINRDLTLEVALKAKADGCPHFIFLSSMAVYGLSQGVVTAETPLAPASAYGRAKLEAEEGLQALASATFRVAVFRPPMVYGPGCPGNYPKLETLVRRVPFFPGIDTPRSFVHIDRLCAAMLHVAATRAEGTFFPRDTGETSVQTLARAIAARHGQRLRTTPVFNPLIRVLVPYVPALAKMFGMLVYDPMLPTGMEEPPCA